MLDLHATSGTPGAVAVEANLATLIANDGTTSAGMPLRPDARLIYWGSASLIANTIAVSRLTSQDCPDPINGELISPSTASLKNLVYKRTNIPYETGARTITQGTNTAQTATSFGFTLDTYDNIPNAIGANDLVFPAKAISISQVQGAADLALSWYGTPVAPATPIPVGKYAILGVWVSLSTGAHLVRFKHADFGFCTPGVPMVDTYGSAILGAQEGMLDELWNNAGYQFLYISQISGKPCIPVFQVTGIGTGLRVESLATATTNTPVWGINLAKVG
jgi:hypothetical protein